MNILIYGNTRDQELIIQHMRSQACMAFRKLDVKQTEDYEEFLILLERTDYDLVFVAMDSATGMEGVIAVKNLQPHTPVIWISNDKNFVAQSYRLGVAYFSVKPIEERMIGLALKRCHRREEYLYE